MKVKFSGLGVVAGSGKIGGTVVARNRGGAYARVKVTPLNPNTSAQQIVRSLLAAFSQQWRTLTQEQISAWNTAVLQFQRTDVFGDLRSPTGKNLFTRLNINIASILGASITDPPLPTAVPSLITNSLVIAVGAVTYTIDYATPTATTSVQIWATPGVSPGVSFVKSEYRLIGSFVGGVAGPADISADYLDKFGPPAVGQKVFVKLVGIDLLTGLNGISTEDSALVLA